MRGILAILLLFGAVSMKAQSFYRPGFGYTPMGITGANNFLNHNIPADKKWSWSSNVGINTGFSFYNGGNSTYMSVPVSLQLNRQLNKNLYAYAAVTAAPTYMNFNGAFLNNQNKMYPGNSMMRSNQFGLYSRAEMGLFYTNDSRTFSISGSISVERSNYPMLPYQPVNQNRQPVNNSNR